MADIVSNTTNSDFMKLNVAYWEQILTSIIIGLIAIIGLIGNSMIIVAVVISRKLRTSTNVFVTSLAATDLLASFFMIPYMVGVLGKDGWPIPQAQWMCVLTGYMVYACTWTSVCTLAAIAINRLLLVTKPFLYHTIYSSSKMALMVAVLWLVPFSTLIVLMVTGVGRFGYDPEDLACAALDTPESGISFSLILCLVGFPLPFLVITISYVWIYLFLKRYFRAKKSKLTVRYQSASSSMSPTTSRECALSAAAVSETEDWSSRDDGIKPATSGDNHKSLVNGRSGEPLNNINTPATGHQLVDVIGAQSGIKDASSTKHQPSTKLSKMSPHRSSSHRRNVSGREKISKQQIEITKNLFTVVCTFSICFVPFFVFYYVSGHVLFYVRVMIFASSALNFAIFALKHPDFKVVFGHMMRCSYSNIPQPSECLQSVLKNKIYTST